MKTKTIASSLLVSSLAWSNAQAEVRVMGNETSLINSVAANYKQKLSDHKQQLGMTKPFTTQDMLYVNVASITTDDYQEVKNVLLAGHLVVLLRPSVHRNEKGLWISCALIRWSAWDTSMYGILSPVPGSTSWELKLHVFAFVPIHLESVNTSLWDRPVVSP